MSRMKKRSGIAAWLVYAAIRVIIAVMQVFPIDWNLQTARLLARIWMRILPKHRKRAFEHLAASLGDQYSAEELGRIADRSLETLVMFAVEVACMPRLITMFTWSRYIRLVNFEELLELMVGGRGVILVTGHYGSFELIGHLLASLGFRMAAVMRPLDNVYLNRFLVHTRRTRGLRLLDKKGAVTDAENVLREGALLGFIGDQDAGRKGLFVEFFGRPAATYKSIGLLAMHVQCPIAVGYARRHGDVAGYDVGVERVIRPEEWRQQEDPLRWITQTYTTAIESFVRREPEQYLWIHRRWKSQPNVKRRRRRLVEESTTAPGHR